MLNLKLEPIEKAKQNPAFLQAAQRMGGTSCTREERLHRGMVEEALRKGGKVRVDLLIPHADLLSKAIEEGRVDYSGPTALESLETQLTAIGLASAAGDRKALTEAAKEAARIVVHIAQQVAAQARR